MLEWSKTFDDIFIYVDKIPAFCRWTDGQTEMVKQYRARHAIYAEY